MPNAHLKNPAMVLKARSVLLAAHDLLSDPSRWTQGTVARDGRDESVPTTDPSAEKFCAIGAIERAAREMRFYGLESHTVQCLANELMQSDLRRHEHTASIPEVNDTVGGYARVMAAFNRLLSPTVIGTLSRRSEAAMKGWETRRRIRAEYAQRLAQPQPMTFGGTLPPTTADATKEIVNVRA
jgi:hypothetical protein